jgi:hypothetical protein
MKTLLTVSLALGLTLPVFAARAASPGPASRQQLLGLGHCSGGPFDTQPCVDADDCRDGADAGVCTTPVSDLELRGVLTLIADKDSGKVEDTSTIPLTHDAAGNLVPADFSGSTLTVVLEFTHDGKDYAFAETYKDLGDYVNPALGIDCHGFCVPTWREPAVENRISNTEGASGPGTGGGGGGGQGSGTGGGGGGAASGGGARVTWATPSPAVSHAILQALGLPPGTIPFLETADTTALFDHSAANDPLATVLRMKVRIRALRPVAAP